MEERDFLSILISIVEVAKKDENSDLCWKKTPWAKQTFIEYLISSTQTRECKQLSCFFNQQNCYQLVYSSVQLSLKSFSQEVTHNRLKAKQQNAKEIELVNVLEQSVSKNQSDHYSQSEWRLTSSLADQSEGWHHHQPTRSQSKNWYITWKAWKREASKSGLVLVLDLIGWEGGTNFLDLWQSEVKKNNWIKG